MHWHSGQHIVLREVHRGCIWSARPVVVVQDAPDLLAFWTPFGTRWHVPVSLDGERLDVQPEEWNLIERPFTLRMLRLATPGAAHSVLLFWQDDEFLAWYVNLEEPLRRTGIGFDYLDQKLDLVINADGSWEWKDEDHLGQAVRQGILGADQAAAVRREGERVLERYIGRKSPFNEGWERWRPNPEWTIPELPKGWDRLP